MAPFTAVAREQSSNGSPQSTCFEWRTRGGDPRDQIQARLSINRANVLRSWPFGALSFCEGDALPLPEVLEPDTLDRGHVEEQVLPLARVNESKAFVGYALYRSFGHLITFE
jgi:hypothetical protein